MGVWPSALGDQTPSSGLQGHLTHTHIYQHRDIDTYVKITFLKNVKTEVGFIYFSKKYKRREYFTTHSIR